ncbi:MULTISPECIES: Y-family DNA polymerase [Methylobacterium]|uniref:Protein ImuB n=1 Tax=Methylobacterium thuringiense TaxID=1003091 RepID=A0ABQ4TIH3_9HYPH|nr:MULTISPECIES: DNA polymerase Y family protein [Methylobacterium]GJE54776.1 Protein ImuB [Methylobacterium thuringiense]
MLTHSLKGALRLAAVSREALALGLRPGLTLADARARIPTLAAAEHDPAADAALLGRMAEACDRWTPLVALDSIDGLSLDVTGCAHLFGGEGVLRDRIVVTFRRGGVSTRGTLAGTPDAARALARFSRVRLVAPGEEEAAVRPLPVAALDLPDTDRAALALAGLKKIADLADLPSRPLAARFGEDLTRQLRCVLGFEDRRITPLRPPPACCVEQRFLEPIAHTVAIERTLRDLIARAALLLETAGRGGRVFEASFFRTDGEVRRIAVETGRPSRDPAAILRLLHERLDSLADPLDPGYGYDLIRLGVPTTESLAPVQVSLDGETVGDGEVSDLVDRLVARFGAARVVRFVSVDTHDPVRAARLVPASAFPTRPAEWLMPEPGEPPLRPLQLFEPPQPIETLAEVPDGPPIRFRWRHVLHKVVRAEGPERISAEWWRACEQPTRDYFRVEDADGRRFWLFRAGLYGSETDRPRWYLHGLFA